MKIFFPFLCLVLVATSIQAGTLFTLEDCYKAALKQSRTLIDQKEQLSQAEARLVQARAGLLPSVIAADTVPLHNSSTANSSVLRVSISQPLFAGLRYLSLFEQAGLLTSAQRSAYQWAYKQICADTAQVYYTLLSLQSDLDHYSDQVGIYDKRIKELTGWVSIGRSRPGDLASMKMARALADAQRVQTSGLATNALKSFSFITGLPEDMSVTNVLDKEITVPDLAYCISSISNREDVLAARIRTDAAKKGSKAASAARFPGLNLSAGYNIPNWMKTGSASWDSQIALTFTVFAGGSINGKIDEAKSVQRQAENAYLLLRETAVRDVKMAHATLKADMAQRDALRDAVKFAEENLKLVEQDYAFGTLKVTDILTALSSLEDARRSFDRLLFSIQLDSVRLAVQSGTFQLPGGIAK